MLGFFHFYTCYFAFSLFFWACYQLCIGLYSFPIHKKLFISPSLASLRLILNHCCFTKQVCFLQHLCHFTTSDQHPCAAVSVMVIIFTVRHLSSSDLHSSFPKLRHLHCSQYWPFLFLEEPLLTLSTY